MFSHRKIFNSFLLCIDMVFEKEAKLYDTEVKRESGEDILYINYLGAGFVPSIADSEDVMAKVIDALIENPKVSRVVLVQQRNYSYDFATVGLLIEIAELYNRLVREEKILSKGKIVACQKYLPDMYNNLSYVLSLLRVDPILSYFETKRLLKEEKSVLDSIPKKYKPYQETYVRLIEEILSQLSSTSLITQSSAYFDSYKPGSREIYRILFKPSILPNFTFTRLAAVLPEDADLVDQYDIETDEGKSSVTIYKKENDTRYYYHIIAPEYTLSEEHHHLLNLARNVMIEHRPKAEEFTDPQRTRQIFLNIAKDLLQEIAKNKKVNLGYKNLEKLASILVRYTIGFGVIEILLQDSKLQDIVLNAPLSLNPIFVRHAEYDECVTNIIPSQEDAESWAAKFRMLSGRPLDEANPVLDTDLSLDKVRARVAIIQEPLSPHGLAYAFRRHREKPWTLPLFIQNKMINPLGAGLLSFLIDGSRTLLVAGTRSAGKTSLLGSLMLEILPKYRVIVTEDSVTGDCNIIVKEKGKFKKTKIGELVDEQIKKYGFKDSDGREKSINSDEIKVFSVNKNGKVILTKPSKFIKHKNTKQIYEIETTSGRNVKVTEDHSLFTLDEKNILKPVKVKNLKEGDFLAIPSQLNFNNSLKEINLLQHLDSFDKKIFVFGKGITEYIENSRKDLFKLAYSLGYAKSTIQNWTKKKILPAKIFKKIKEKVKEEESYLKSYGASKEVPTKLKLDENFLNFIGLWIADGCYDKNAVILSVQEEKNRECVRKIADRFGINLKMHSDKFSLMLNSAMLKEVMEKILNLTGNAYTKNIPQWAYNLSNKQIGYLLKGIFSGDGCVSDKEILFSVRSKELVEDINTLLLRFNIIARNGESFKKNSLTPEKRKMFHCRIGVTKYLKRFNKNIGFLVKSKQNKLEKLCSRVSNHDTSDIIPLSIEVKKELNEILGKKFNNWDYISRKNNLGRENLNNLLRLVPKGITNPIDPLREIVKSDLFWDKIKKVKKIKYEGDVYDISVPGCENFICNNIVAHNTLELPVDSLRRIGYDILRMKVRSALLQTKTEVSASEGIRTSLRLGDSCLILGEVRSEEAKALYEAMRVGALANVVAGTIHGANPYSVFDRVVNDLGVPVTSFKATDLILAANPVKSPSGLQSWRRVISLSEVRKHWTKDPLEERGFVDLLKYNVETDKLEATPELINGESEVIKQVASQVKGWAGDWDAVYDNILLRAKVKKELVNYAEKLKKPEITEAKFNFLANNAFHQISDEIREEVGIPEGKKVLPKFQEWLRKFGKKV